MSILVSQKQSIFHKMADDSDWLVRLDVARNAEWGSTLDIVAACCEPSDIENAPIVLALLANPFTSQDTRLRLVKKYSLMNSEGGFLK